MIQSCKTNIKIIFAQEIVMGTRHFLSMRCIKIQKRQQIHRHKLQKELIAIQADELEKQSNDAALQKELGLLYKDHVKHQQEDIEQLQYKIAILEALVRQHEDTRAYMNQRVEVLEKIAAFLQKDACFIRSIKD